MESRIKKVIDLHFDSEKIENYLAKLNLNTEDPPHLESDKEKLKDLTLNFNRKCSISQISGKENVKTQFCLNTNSKNSENISFKIKENVEKASSDFVDPALNDLNSTNRTKISIKKEIDLEHIDTFFNNKIFCVPAKNYDGNVLNISDNVKAEKCINKNYMLNASSLKNKTSSPILIKKEVLNHKIETSSDSDIDEDEILTRGPKFNKEHYYKRKQQFGKQSRPNFSNFSQFSSEIIPTNSGVDNSLQQQIGNFSTNFNFENRINYSIKSPVDSDSGISQSTISYSSSPSNSFFSSSPLSDLYPSSPSSLSQYSPSSHFCATPSPFESNFQVSDDFETPKDEEFYNFILSLEEKELLSIIESDRNFPVLDNDGLDSTGTLTIEENKVKEMKHSKSRTDSNKIFAHASAESSTTNSEAEIKAKQNKCSQAVTQRNNILAHKYDSAKSSTNSTAVPLTMPSTSTKVTALKNVWQKISFKLNNSAKKILRSSESFNREKYLQEQSILFATIRKKELSGKEVKIIECEEEEVRSGNVKKKENDEGSSRQTNLHKAVLQSDIEKVYCLVEALKRYQHSFSDINNRDADNKTALDYAIKMNMPLVIDYLRENNAVQGIVL